MKRSELKEFLDEKAALYNQISFLDTDPIQIPHRFSKKEDIEIAAFLTATIAWGNRKSIIQNAARMVELMDESPHDFVMNFNPDLEARFKGFVHRTFNEVDMVYFLKALQHIYLYHGGLETIFSDHAKKNNLQQAIHEFRALFFELPHPGRTEKHISDPLKNSAAKRINMFLRWMVRDNSTGVDFGLWNSISPAQLSCPLDVHSGNVARKLKLLKRKANDAKAVLELDNSLRKLDPMDPVKYDFALFGLGVFEKF
ncbi:TIGR02757 family protein [Aureitalea sp. L0-47]|uniref:TIGR02757 family protein n=1 Tax=Aureitalea sp. L0-47 TaxID=2816962 RepID=UPI0022372D46|nr:TIGR02757 family protein [Aureitalea sp. L0-47]MCW5520534.1 TIGR02757 family protein [Aureitalea sp. L0-47]